MKKWLLRLGFVAAIAFLALTVVNASWLAETPRGKVKLISHGGASQYYDRADLSADDCTATLIEEVSHPYLENTPLGAMRAAELGARMIAVDLAATSDGELVVFGDQSLDCRTNASGPVSAKTAAELQALDAGYGYSADGGTTFPLRGEGIGGIRPVGYMSQSVGRSKPMFFRFGSDNPQEADILVAKLREAGRDLSKVRDGFYGPAEPVARLKQLVPDAWAFTPEDARQCARDYVLTGWYGNVPQSCQGGTILIPVDEQWKFWGWPNRLMERMAEYDTQIIVTGPQSDADPITGLSLPEQLGDIPNSFNGFIWVDDSWNIVPALNPKRDGRRDHQKEAAIRALEKRRGN